MHYMIQGSEHNENKIDQHEFKVHEIHQSREMPSRSKPNPQTSSFKG